MTAGEEALRRRLAAMVASSKALMAALRAARALGLRDWCIGAGAVRSLAWDHLHALPAPTPLNDIDLVYFDMQAGPDVDAQLERRLALALPGPRWEVSNQAHIHHWFARALGQRVAPLRSMEEGVATWPEYATCVGVRLEADDALTVVAPHGLDDLFALLVRHNPLRAGAAVYAQRLREKTWSARWPLLSIAPAA